jgi:hypothetical protein
LYAAGAVPARGKKKYKKKKEKEKERAIGIGFLSSLQKHCNREMKEIDRERKFL